MYDVLHPLFAANPPDLIVGDVQFPAVEALSTQLDIPSIGLSLGKRLRIGVVFVPNHYIPLVWSPNWHRYVALM